MWRGLYLLPNSSSADALVEQVAVWVCKPAVCKQRACGYARTRVEAVPDHSFRHLPFQRGRKGEMSLPGCNGTALCGDAVDVLLGDEMVCPLSPIPAPVEESTS